MTFANPWALTGLIAVAPLVLMYLYREQIRTMSVSSLLFWEKLQPHVRPTRSVRMQRFLSTPLFWIQLILLVLLVGGLAQPVAQSSARKIVLVIDISASMQTREQGGARLDLAKARAMTIIDDLEGADRMALIAMAHQPELILNFTDDVAALQENVSALQALDTPTNMQAALSLATSLQDTEGGMDVVVISDQRDEQAVVLQDSARIRQRFLIVGKTGENVGIVALNQQSSMISAQGIGGDLLLRNYTPEPKPARLKIVQDNRTFLDVAIELPPNGSIPVAVGALPLPLPVTALLEVADSLAMDNRVVFLQSAYVKPTMLVTTDAAGFARMCRQLDKFRVTVRSTPSPQAPGESFDVYVYDRTAPVTYPQGGTVVVCPPGTGQQGGEREIYDWDADHPLLRDIVMERLSIAGTRIVEPPPWASVLARTQSYPIVLAGQYEGHRRAIITPNLAAQLENPSALLLFIKAVEWVNPLSNRETTHLRTGEPFVMRVPADSGYAVSIRSPDGEIRELEPQNGVITYPHTTRAGVYEINVNGSIRYFTANLLDAAESDIRPAVTNDPEPPLQFQSQSILDAAFWRWTLWGCLALLMVEWVYSFTRRNDGTG